MFGLDKDSDDDDELGGGMLSFFKD